MSYVTHLNEWCHTDARVVSHIWMSDVTQMHELCQTFELVMSHRCTSCVTHLNKWCHTYAWVMSHIWMSYVTHLNEDDAQFDMYMSHSFYDILHRRDMGWLRLVGSLKSYVSFAKEPYKRAYILQKRPINSRSLLLVATPYVTRCLTNIVWHNSCMTYVTNESWLTYEWVMAHI